MTFNKYLMWARSGITTPSKSTPDAKYRRKAKKRLFAGKKKRPCTYCGKDLTYKNATIDHITAQSKGGRNIGNLALACKTCNHRKGSMPAEHFRELLAKETTE